MSQRINTITVLGGGTAGFIAALTLKQRMPTLDITVIRSKSIPVIGVGESTTPWFITHLGKHLNIKQSDFYHHVRPVWKLGNKLLWGPEDFNYPFGGQYVEVRLPNLSYESAYYMMRLGLGPANLYAALMDANRSPMVQLDNGQYILDERHAFHIENKPFIDFLEMTAKQRGITITDKIVEDATLTPDGHIDQLLLKNNETHKADFYIDASGFSAKLIGKVLNEPFNSYADSLFCDSAVVTHWQRDGEILPYTTAETMDHGWCWRTEFEHHVNRGYVYSSQFCDEETAINEVRAKNPDAGDNFNVVKFPSGHRKRFWVKNVAAIGNAAGFVEPLEATNLQMISLTALALAEGLRDSAQTLIPKVMQLNNEHINNWWEDIRAFLALHFKYNTRLDTPFWQHCRNDTNLARAEEFVELYQAAGPSGVSQMTVTRETVFGHAGYLAMAVGQKIPTNCPIEIPDNEAQIWHQTMQRARDNAAKALPMRKALEIIHSPQWQWKN